MSSAPSPRLIVSPEEFSLSRPDRQNIDIELTNPSNAAVVYKLKTTKPQLFTVKPRIAFIPPSGTIRVNIAINEKEPFVAGRELFQVEFRTVDAADFASDDPRGVFAKATTNASKRISCNLTQSTSAAAAASSQPSHSSQPVSSAGVAPSSSTSSGGDGAAATVDDEAALNAKLTAAAARLVAAKNETNELQRRKAQLAQQAAGSDPSATSNGMAARNSKKKSGFPLVGCVLLLLAVAAAGRYFG